MAFTSTGLASSVEGAIGGNLYLLLKKDTEDLVGRNLFNFASSRNLTGSPDVYPGPVLTLDYTAVPEPSAALLGGLGLLALLRRRR